MAPKPDKKKRDPAPAKDVKGKKKPIDYNEEYIIGDDELDEFFAEYGEDILAEKNNLAVILLENLLWVPAVNVKPKKKQI